MVVRFIVKTNSLLRYAPPPPIPPPAPLPSARTIFSVENHFDKRLLKSNYVSLKHVNTINLISNFHTQ